jgi:uncharacterized protein (TIGR03435 family)
MSYQLEGPPSIESDRFDIDAKIPPGTTNEQFNLMLQNLLVERFGLVVHRETREVPIYELVVAKGGLKMKAPEKPPAGAQAESPVAPGSSPPAPHLTNNKDGMPEFPPGTPGMFGMPTAGGGLWLTARMQTIARLLSMLQFQIGRPVVDKTGLTGIYDFNLRYAYIPTGVEPGVAVRAAAAPTGLDSANDAGPDLFSAIESQLGLKLESKKGPVEFVVVDRVNRTPTENCLRRLQALGDFFFFHGARLDHPPVGLRDIDRGGAGAGAGSGIEHQVHAAVHRTENLDAAAAGGAAGDIRADGNGG